MSLSKQASDEQAVTHKQTNGSTEDFSIKASLKYASQIKCELLIEPACFVVVQWKCKWWMNNRNGGTSFRSSESICAILAKSEKIINKLCPRLGFLCRMLSQELTFQLICKFERNFAVYYLRRKEVYCEENLALFDSTCPFTRDHGITARRLTDHRPKKNSYIFQKRTKKLVPGVQVICRGQIELF